MATKYCKNQYKIHTFRRVLGLLVLVLGLVGPVLGHLGPVLGLSWAILGHVGPFLGLSWVVLSLFWAYVSHLAGIYCLLEAILANLAVFLFYPKD